MGANPEDDLRRIEAHYARSPFVGEACLIHGPGIATPGPPRHLIVVPDHDAVRTRRTVNLRDLLRFELETCGVTLPATDRMTGFDVSPVPLPRLGREYDRDRVDALWRTNWAGLRSVSADGQAELVADDAFAASALRAIHASRPDAMVTRATHLDLDLRLDSLERVDLLLEAERLAGVRLAEDTTWRIVTAGDLVDALREAPSGHHRVPSGADNWKTLLQEPVSVTGLARGIAAPKPLRAVVAFCALRFARLLMRPFVDLRVSGTQLLPSRGPFLLTPNHQTYIDGFLVCAALPLTQLQSIFIVGAPEYFSTPLLARLAAAFNLVPVDPDANLVGAMQTAATGLRRGKALLIFPEGERCLDGPLVAFRRGASILATRLDVPLVPIAIDGAFALWPRGRALAWRTLRPFHRPIVRIAFGAPMRPGRDGVPSDDVALTASLRATIDRMLRESEGPGSHA